MFVSACRVHADIRLGWRIQISKITTASHQFYKKLNIDIKMYQTVKMILESNYISRSILHHAVEFACLLIEEWYQYTFISHSKRSATRSIRLVEFTIHWLGARRGSGDNSIVVQCCSGMCKPIVWCCSEMCTPRWPLDIPFLFVIKSIWSPSRVSS